MLFTSPEFLFYFLPVIFGLYRILPGVRAQNIFLLTASGFFYFWGETWQIMALLFTVISAYFAAILIEGARSDRRRKTICASVVVLNVVFLIIFKYAGFAAASLRWWLSLLGTRYTLGVPKIPLPL